MLNEYTIEELARRVRVDADRKRDFIAPTKQANVFNGGANIMLSDGYRNYDGIFIVNARRQLVPHLCIPSHSIANLQAISMHVLI